LLQRIIGLQLLKRHKIIGLQLLKRHKMCQVVYNSENTCWTNIIKLYKMHGTYTISLRCLIGDDLV